MTINSKRKNLVPYLFYGILNMVFFLAQVNGQIQVLDNSTFYIQNGGQPEWAEFDRLSPVKELHIRFRGEENAIEQTLQLKQYDVKQPWQVLLNNHKLGALITDVNDMTVYFAIPPKLVVPGQNVLSILPASTVPDGILIGQFILHKRSLQDLLNEASLDLEVLDKKTSSGTPSRITIVNATGSLQMTAASSTPNLAARAGNIYTLNGKASIGLPAGRYTIYAGRGFEYSIDSLLVVVQPGERLHKKLSIQPEVPTEGWISSDTHIHTYTHSGHGDASTEERALSTLR